MKIEIYLEHISLQLAEAVNSLLDCETVITLLLPFQFVTVDKKFKFLLPFANCYCLPI